MILLQFKEIVIFCHLPPPPPEEICDDGIDNDDDDDGLIDCEDSDCNCEICDDGIDNDGDGLIDSEDPDCNPNNVEICCDGIDNDGDGDGDIDEADSDCCYRDCREDYNMLLLHKFRNLINALATVNSQVPGGERITQIKYEITSLEKDCPTCLPVAVHSNQIVTAHTYRLVCNENTMDSDPWEVFSPEDYSTLCVSSGSLESFISHPAFISGAAFDNESTLLTYYDDGEVYFELTDNIFVLLSQTSPVKTPILYLRGIKDWDASLIANEVRLSMYEIDEVESSSGGGTSVQVTNTHVVSGKFGAKFKIFEIGAEAEVSYSFTNQTQNTATTTYSITAKDVYELGDLSLNYCNQENYQHSFYSSTLAEYYQTDGLFHQIDVQNGNLIWLDVIEDLD
ncbi:MAG: hypothetical protein ACI9LN_002989 [Saprospiraceae bacterium]|jgi:hypothetical protein